MAQASTSWHQNCSLNSSRNRFSIANPPYEEEGAGSCLVRRAKETAPLPALWAQRGTLSANALPLWWG